MEKLEFTGRKGKAVIRLAQSNDGQWRSFIQIDLHDKMNTFSGYYGCLHEDQDGYSSREEAIVSAIGELEERLEEDYNNPKSCAEVRAWIDSLGVTRRQLGLFV